MLFCTKCVTISQSVCCSVVKACVLLYSLSYNVTVCWSVYLASVLLQSGTHCHATVVPLNCWVLSDVFYNWTLWHHLGYSDCKHSLSLVSVIMLLWFASDIRRYRSVIWSICNDWLISIVILFQVGIHIECEGCHVVLLSSEHLYSISWLLAGVPQRQPHRRSDLATLPSVGAIP